MGAGALVVADDAAGLAREAAEWLAGVLMAKAGPSAVCLSGGSTPRLLYELLARAPLVGRVPWDRVHWFWGDERFVPPGDARSNYRMAMDAMLGHVPAPRGMVHGVPTVGVTPAEAALRYAAELQGFYGASVLDAERPLFDVVLLGLGTNGHTASLFPGEAVLGERVAWAAAATPAGEATRITLTYPVLESCRHAAFLVVGADKRAVMARVRAGGSGLPAEAYRPVGALHWFADRAAAGGA